jgi:alpha-beta hydrolase superfamily lysophospholipase
MASLTPDRLRFLRPRRNSTQAVDEFPAVLVALRERLEIADGPIGVVGASIGALPAQLVMADSGVPVSAEALISPVIQLAEVVAANERRFGVTYAWSKASRAVATRFELVARAAEIAADPPPAVLLITGADDCALTRGDRTPRDDCGGGKR